MFCVCVCDVVFVYIHIFNFLFSGWGVRYSFRLTFCSYLASVQYFTWRSCRILPSFMRGRRFGLRGSLLGL